MRGNPKQVVAINKNGKFSAFTQYKFIVRIIHIIIVILIIMIDQGVDCDPEIYEGDVRCYTMASQCTQK